jgi:hypothetical protein
MGRSAIEPAATSTARVDRPCVCRTESFRFCPCYSTRSWQRGDPTTDLPTAPVWRPSAHKKVSEAA